MAKTALNSGAVVYNATMLPTMWAAGAAALAIARFYSLKDPNIQTTLSEDFSDLIRTEEFWEFLSVGYGVGLLKYGSSMMVDGAIEISDGVDAQRAAQTAAASQSAINTRYPR